MNVVVPAKARGGFPLSLILLEFLPAAMAMLLLAAVAIVHVTSRVMVVKMGYELSKQDSVGAALMRENDELRLELATLKNPARLESFAKKKLNLVPPAASDTFHLKP